MTLASSSVFDPWARLRSSLATLTNHEQRDNKPRHVRYHQSTVGISDSAKLIEEYNAGMLVEQEQWTSMLPPRKIEDVEQEVIVFLPPVRSRTVRLHIQQVNHPGPLIYLED